MRTFRTTAALSLVSALAIAMYAGAQAKRPMTLVDMLEVPQLNDPQLSIDSKQIVFVLTKANWKANNRISHIWRIQTDGSGLVQMTSGAKGENSPRWSPDGSRIAFVGRRSSSAAAPSENAEESSQIFLLSNSGGEAQQLTHHATAVSSITWTPTGDGLYFLSSEPKSAEEKEREKQKDDVYAFDENYKQTHLWKVTIANEKENRLTEGDFSILGYKLSRDGEKIAVNRAPSPLFGDQDQSEIFVMSKSGTGSVQITKNRISEGNLDFSPDGSQLLFLAGANQKFETYFDGNLFIVPATGGDARLVLPDYPHGIENAAWAGDGRSIYLLANMGVHSELYRMDVATKQVKQLTDGEHSLGSWAFSDKNATHVFTSSNTSSPGEVYLLGASTGAPARVTRVFEYIAREFTLPREEKIQWKGADGVTVEGILTYPIGYQEGKSYPLAVHTHGGPRSSDKMSFSSWRQYRPVLAAKGYAVLLPNYRGSTGYGNAFMRDMVGHYFRQAHLDVIAGVDYLIERGIADPNRLVKMGWSAGGHMTNKIITFTDRFKAASSGAGAANWISMYAQSDVRTYRTPWFGGTPWQKDAPISAYWDNSPLKDIWKVKTPTIFLVGEKDVRVPMPQSVEMYRALKSNGIPTHLYVAPREPHGWGELRHELFKMNVELDWFEKYAMNRPYVWEKAPGDDEKPREKSTPSSQLR